VTNPRGVPSTRRATSKRDVIVLALAQASGATQVVDTEDVAVEAFRLAPEIFRWRKYADQIDLDMVRVALRHAAEGEDPRIAGSVKTGWNLTATGAEWVRQFGTWQPAGGDILTTTKSTGVRRENLAQKRECDRLRRHPALRKFERGDALTPNDARSIFRIDQYTEPRERGIKIERLRTLVEGEADLEALVKSASALLGEVST
jgi:hypothetical protein